MKLSASSFVVQVMTASSSAGSKSTLEISGESRSAVASVVKENTVDSLGPLLLKSDEETL